MVVGGGFSGLLAALIYARKGIEIHVIEKNALGIKNEVRKGAPQGAHIHIFSKHGLNILNKLFPDIEERFARHGFPRLHFTRDIRWVGPYGAFPQFTSDFGDIFSFHRPNLDLVLREMLEENPNVKFFGNETFERLECKENIVCGVHTEKNFFPAEKVILATGRSFNIVSHLESVGVKGIREEKILSPLRYRSFLIKTPHFESTSHKAIMATTFGQLRPHGTVIFPLGDGTHIVTQVAQEFNLEVLPFSQTLHDDEITTILENAEFVSNPIQYKLQGSRRILFSKPNSWPKGLLALGDSVSYLNPIFAQGLTMALVHAEALDQWVNSESSESEFQLMLEKRSQEAWMMGTIEDRRLSAPFWQRPLFSIAERYLGEFLSRATQNRELYLRYIRAAHMLTSSKSIFKKPYFFNS